MLNRYSIQTDAQNFHNITRQVEQAVRESRVEDGICIVHCPHTTAGLTVNENADPDVVSDLLYALDKTFPDRPEFRHMEGNTAAHLKASCMGSSVTLPVERGRLVLGTWQGIYFCEFDGPRSRSFFVKVMQG